MAAVARDTSRRVHSAQQAILAQRMEREAKEARLLKNRLSRARSGLRRLLAFANSAPIRRIAKINECLRGKLGLLFDEDQWNFIGTRMTSRIAFFIDTQGIRITMRSLCHRSFAVDAVFPYKGSEVVMHSDFAGTSDSWSASSEETLNHMAVGAMTPLWEINEESEAALRTLASWSRQSTFEKVAVAFLENLERQVVQDSRKMA